jgi:membrane-associated phospholipid phosphatase
MDALIESGISIIIAIQGLGGWMTAPMRFFSSLGTEEFFFLVLPLIYWCIDASLGLRVGLILVTSDVVNYTFKLLFAGPRPYWVTSKVKGLWSETSFGIPSGHAQHAMSVWGIIASYVKKNWAWAVAGFFIFFIGFSRLYLGSHFLHDVLTGWLLGGILLFAFTRLWDRVADNLLKKTMSQQITIAFVISLIFILIGFSAATLRKDFQMPEQWTSNALLVQDEVPAPVDPNGIFTAAGTFFGLALGAAWILQNGGYQASGPMQKRVIRYVLGLIGVLIFWMGLGAVIPRGDGFIFYILRYVRYALVGWWVSGGAPWLFMKMNIAERPNTSI